MSLLRAFTISASAALGRPAPLATSRGSRLIARSYAHGQVGGAHPPPEQGGSRSRGTTRMLGLSIAALGVGIAGFFMLSQDTRKAAVGMSGHPAMSKVSGSKDRAAQILKKQSSAAKNELEKAEHQAAGAVKEVGQEL